MSDQPIKILCLSRWYPNKYDSMLGLFVKRQMEALTTAQNADITVLYIHYDKNIETNQSQFDYSVESNIKTLRIYYGNSFKIFKNLFQFYFFIKYYYKGIKYLFDKQGKPDLVHVNILTRTGLVGLFLKVFKNIPYIISEHWSRYLPEVNNYCGFARKLLTKIIVKHADAVIVVNERLKNAMLSNGLYNSNYYIVPNVVNTEVFVPNPDNLEINKTQKRIINITCFEDKSKNISGILRAIKELSVFRHDFELHLVGEGEDKTMLENLAEDMGIKNKYIFFDGLLEGDTLVNSINSSAFMIVFSNYETYSIVITESMSCGVPVLTTKVGVATQPEYESLVCYTDIKNENDLREKINYMLDSYIAFDKKKIRDYIINNYNNSIISDRLIELYEKSLIK